MRADFRGKSLPLSETGLNNVCEQLGTEPAELWAVLHVETTGCGFLEDGRPKILFERHVFSRETDHVFDQEHQDISNRQSGGYGSAGAFQYERLEKAMDLNREAALRSASWGIGQLMGFNAVDAGFTDANAMIAAMLESEDQQLIAMANFLKHDGLNKALEARDWRTFAREYNGPDFEQNGYDRKLNAAFAQYSILLPDLTVRTGQVLLTFLKYHPGTIDGIMGKTTRSAIEQFQEIQRLPVTGNIDETTLDRMWTAAAPGN